MAEDRELQVLVLEPYYGGSHRQFLSNIRTLPFQIEWQTLSAHNWKWRMRLSAPLFAEALREMDRRFDRIICSPFLDVATFRGLAPQWVRDVPVLTYFHENQFVYPVQVEDKRDLHFAITNMTTALSSDSLAFNSDYNLTTFLTGIRELLKKSPDMKMDDPCQAIRAKSGVLPPGIDFSLIDDVQERVPEGPSLILWNHRWEHDKNPERFFEALFELDRQGLDFRIVLLGESFRHIPPVFDEARERLSHRIMHSGFLSDRKEYIHWLKQCTTVVSTALHEFFGLAIIESVRAGCRPLLPRRLSYPELFPDEFLYDEHEFIGRLRQEVLSARRLAPGEAKALTEPYSWSRMAPAFESWIRHAGHDSKS